MLQNALDHDDLLITHLGDIADTKAEYYIRLEEILTDYKRMYAEKKYKTVFVGDEDDDYQVLSDDYYIYIDTITNKPYTLNDVKYPFYPVVGNHDITRSGWALWSSIFHTSFYSIYVTVNTDPMTVDKFIFLDTANGTLGREQVSLIEQGVLDAKKQEEVGLYVRNTFVFSHTNIFHVSSMELASSFAREETYFLLNQFKEWNVNIAFFGHVHEWDERRNGKTEYLTLETMCEANNPSPGDYLVRVHVRKDGTIRWERVRMNYTPSE
jgi:predicted phosphodiesterase